MKINYFSKALSLILSLSIIIASFTILGGMAVNASNLVDAGLVNGGFDSNTDGWKVTADSGASLTAATDSNSSTLTKGNAAKLVNAGKTAWLYQAIKLQAGTYIWEFTTDTADAKSFIIGVYNNEVFDKNSLIQGTVQSHAKTTSWADLEYRSANGDYQGPGSAHRYNKYTFVLEDETVVYLAVRSNANNGATLFADNMTLNKVKTLDTTLYDFDSNGQFDDSFVVSDSNQSSSMKVQTVDSGDTNHNNVLTLPKYDNSGREKSARFYKMLDGLTVGNTYEVTFDLKFVDYTADKVSDWIALTGVTNTTKRPLTLQSGNNIINYSDNTLATICNLPSKFVATTDNDYTIAVNDNGLNCVIMWNGGKEWATYTMKFIAENDEYFFYIENYRAVTDLYIDNIQFSLSDEQLDTGLDKTAIQDEDVPSVLIIGNSFAGDTFYEFDEILNASSENKLRVGKYGKGAQTPNYFAKQINNGLLGADFCYAEKGYTGNSTLSTAVSFDKVMEFTNWKYVLIQTTTIEYNETFVGYTVELVNALINKGFEKSQIFLYIPWNARQDYLDRNGNYSNVSAQLTAIKDYIALLKANKNLEGCSFMSVHNEIYDLQKFIINIHRGTYGVNDGLHLNKIGQTAVSMALFHKFTGVDVTDNTVFNYSNLDFTDTKWPDNNGGIITKVQLDALKTIANGEFPEVYYGDANYDGLLDIRDLVCIKKLIINQQYTIGADCVEDESLNSDDLTQIRKWLLGIFDNEINSLNLED